MKRVKVGDDSVYQDDNGILLVTNKAQGWIHFPEPPTRKRLRDYAKAIKMAKGKCGLNGLSLVDHIRVEGDTVFITGEQRPMSIPTTEVDINNIYSVTVLNH